MSHFNKLNRRNFIRSAAGLGLAGLAYGSGVSTVFAKPYQIKKIGLQLYTVRDLMKENVEKTLHQVAALGYQEVEFAGYFGHSAEEIRKFLDQAGLTTPSAHVGLETIRDNLDAAIEFAHTLGQKYMVMPWLSKDQHQTLDQFKSYAELFNKAGEACKKASIQLAYHNHAFEFQALEGREPYDLLLEETDPDLLKMELDLYWIIKAGRDPFDYFARYPGRFPLCHVKDMSEGGDITDVGRGIIDFEKLFAAQKTAGFKHFFVEHDEPVNALNSIAYSVKTMRRLSE